jgi:hypothetical protein
MVSIASISLYKNIKYEEPPLKKIKNEKENT